MCDLQPNVEIRLPATPSALADVRRTIRDTAAHGHVDSEQTELAALFATEASTNIIRHTHASVIDLTVGCLGDHLQVRVADDDPTPITPQPPSLDATSGRGLLIIDRLAAHWGVDVHADGKDLWAETAKQLDSPDE